MEERVQRLEDVEATKNLTVRYVSHVDKGLNGKTVDLDGLRSVFAEDATWKSADMQISGAGIDQIVQGVKDQTAGVEFSMHSFTNPVIAVHADQATGTWLLWIASKIGGEAREVFLGEDVTYVRTPLGWRMKSVNLHVGMALIA